VEVTGIQHATHTTGPLVVNWHFKKAPGSANLVVNSDGTYLFSGNYNRKAPEVFDILLGLKSSLGRIYLFNYAGDASNGVQWSKHGKSAILKDDFNTFDKHDWIGSYRFHLTAEGREDKRICLAQPEKVATFFYPVVPSWTGGHCIWVYAY